MLVQGDDVQNIHLKIAVHITEACLVARLGGHFRHLNGRRILAVHNLHREGDRLAGFDAVNGQIDRIDAGGGVVEPGRIDLEFVHRLGEIIPVDTAAAAVGICRAARQIQRLTDLIHQLVGHLHDIEVDRLLNIVICGDRGHTGGCHGSLGCGRYRGRLGGGRIGGCRGAYYLHLKAFGHNFLLLFRAADGYIDRIGAGLGRIEGRGIHSESNVSQRFVKDIPVQFLGAAAC